MARFGVRSGSVAFARSDEDRVNKRFERTGANPREHRWLLPCTSASDSRNSSTVIACPSVLLNETAEVESAAGAMGFRFFTQVEAFKSYVRRELCRRMGALQVATCRYKS